MKKLVVYLCVSVLVLGLTACMSDKVREDSPIIDEQTEDVVQKVPGMENEEMQETADEEFLTDVDVEVVAQAVKDTLGEDYWPNTQMPPEFLKGYGLTEDMYQEFLGEMPLISANVDTLVVIRAQENQAENVEAVLNAYRNALINDTFQYPANVGKIQASMVETFGDYVCFVQLGADVSKLVDLGNEEVIKHCQKQNETALQAIQTALKE